MLCSKCNEPIRPVVVFDIDGTLGDYHRHFRNFCTDYFGTNMPTGYDGSVEFHEWLGLELKDYRAAKLAYRQGGLKRSMDTYLYATEAVQAARAAGAEVWIATTRPYNRLDNIDPDTVEWCRRNRIAFDGLLYGDDKYAQLVDHIDPSRVVAIFEDLPMQYETAQMLFDGAARLMAREHNAPWRAERQMRGEDWEYTAETIGDDISLWMMRMEAMHG